LELNRKEVIIFKYPKDSQVIDDAEPKKKFRFLAIRRGDPKTVAIIQGSAKHKQTHKLPTPPTIEKITSNQYQSILPT
jgi:hypothetical protein